MKNRTLIASFSVAVLSLFAVGARAQHAQHHPSEQNSGAGMMGGGMMGGGMMGPGMMGQKMMAQHPAMQALMDQLRQNMTAPENEKDPAARGKLMAEQCALLGKMHGEMAQQGKATGGLMENCPILGTNQQATDPTGGVEFGGGG